jgi:hypothetical protein
MSVVTWSTLTPVKLLIKRDKFRIIGAIEELVFASEFVNYCLLCRSVGGAKEKCMMSFII